MRSKSVKYKIGDCLSFACNDNTYLVAFISTKPNAYYELTLVEHSTSERPQFEDIIKSRCFGTRFGSWEGFDFGLDKALIKRKIIDDSACVEYLGRLALSPNLVKEGYSYFNTPEDLQRHYLEELPTRIVKTKNAEKFPEIAFAGNI